MTYTAQISDGVVTQVIVGNAEWATVNLGGVWVLVEDVYPGLGWKYDGITFEPPPSPNVEP